MIALVGKSGSGKSTIADILARFYEVNQGEIDNVNINKTILNKFRNLFGIVTQEAILFNDTVYNNIRLGKLDAIKEEITTVAKVANADIFINEMENGYNTFIGEKGDKLSEVKNRISIARAI